jgi:hypothetical protein
VEYGAEVGLYTDLKQPVLFLPLCDIRRATEPPERSNKADVPRTTLTAEADLPYTRAGIDHNTILSAIKRMAARGLVMGGRVHDRLVGHPVCRWGDDLR